MLWHLKRLQKVNLGKPVIIQGVNKSPTTSALSSKRETCWNGSRNLSVESWLSFRICSHSAATDSGNRDLCWVMMKLFTRVAYLSWAASYEKNRLNGLSLVVWYLRFEKSDDIALGRGFKVVEHSLDWPNLDWEDQGSHLPWANLFQITIC